MTAVEIVNLSLAMMGVDPIMAFTDDTKIAGIVNRLYIPTLKYLLSLHNWNFLLKRVSLPQLADNPNSDLWTYAYQEPSDLIKVESLRDSSDNKVEYEEFGNVIYSNANPVYLRYVYYVDGYEPYFPYYFIETLKFKLASELALAVKGEPRLYTAYLTLFEKSLRLARGLDSQRTNVQFVDNSQWLKDID